MGGQPPSTDADRSSARGFAKPKDTVHLASTRRVAGDRSADRHPQHPAGPSEPTRLSRILVAETSSRPQRRQHRAQPVTLRAGATNRPGGGSSQTGPWLASASPDAGSTRTLLAQTLGEGAPRRSPRPLPSGMDAPGLEPAARYQAGRRASSGGLVSHRANSVARLGVPAGSFSRRDRASVRGGRGGARSGRRGARRPRAIVQWAPTPRRFSGGLRSGMAGRPAPGRTCAQIF